jgi:alpha-L-fucosidase
MRPPVPHLPVPSPRQLRWHDLEFYGFLHFTVNTFTDKEWGYGDESPSVFNPSALDARQWVQVAKDAGMRGLILTAKHHDGFCLWPSRYTEHSVKNSPWKDGHGDVVREFVDACAEFGLHAGLYLSPWDRNHAEYGRPAYVEYYRNQLEELLTQYGELFEIWFDGANGGDGYYGGAREARKIDAQTYYGFPELWALVRQHQPNAILFSDAGPDIRWIGNESGYAPATWTTSTAWDAARRTARNGGRPRWTSRCARAGSTMTPSNRARWKSCWRFTMPALLAVAACSLICRPTSAGSSPTRISPGCANSARRWTPASPAKWQPARPSPPAKCAATTTPLPPPT